MSAPVLFHSGCKSFTEQDLQANEDLAECCLGIGHFDLRHKGTKPWGSCLLFTLNFCDRATKVPSNSRC